MPFRTLLPVLLLLCTHPLFSAESSCANCGMSVTVQRAASRGNTIGVIEMENSFKSANITIIAGDTVKWTNNGQEDHTATSDAGLWDSGRMKPGATYSHTFKKAGEFPYNCTYHKTMGMRGSVTVLPPVPVITSPLTANAGTALPFYYAIEASNDPATFATSPLPAGLLLTNNTITGRPTTAGTYTITISAISPSGTGSATLTLKVVDAIPEPDQDTDEFPDALETFTASDPADAASTPFAIPASTSAQIKYIKIGIALHFGTPGKDSFKLSGKLPIAGAIVPGGQVITLDFGGILKQFTLDSHGAAKSGGDTIKLALKPGLLAQDAKFSINLSKGNFAAPLAQIGFNGSADLKSEPKALSLIILANATRYQTTQVVAYSSKLNKSATAK